MSVAADFPVPNKFVINADSTDDPTFPVNVITGYDQTETEYYDGSMPCAIATSEVSNVRVQQTHPAAAENSLTVVKSEVCVIS